MLLLLAAACCTSTRTIGQPTLSVHDETISLTRRDKVDILFMIDDSPSMAPKQKALLGSFPELVTRIQALATDGVPASFHIGVVDSDLGAGPYTLNQGQCHPGGDGGKLRTCATLPGISYIDYDSASGASNLGTVDVATAFTCLASVGEAGCGFEHQLESVYRALTTPSLNPGFLRDDALLVVVWLTDEDDCSAPPDSPLFDPSSAGVASYGILHSFRCTQFGITCDQQPLTGGTLSSSSCTPLTGGPLFDIKRYTDLFAAGGIKQSASDVLLVAIDAPASPVDVAITSPCADQMNAASCAVLQHSCVSATSASFFGDPAVRIDAVLSSTQNAVVASICDEDDTTTFDSLSDAMSARMRAGCLPGAVVDVTDPGCHVTVDGGDTPRCSSEGRLPCWDLTGDNGCPARLTPGGATQTLRFVIEGATGGASVVATCPLYEPTP